MKRAILVTGSQGFVGRCLTSTLARRGLRTLGLGTPGSGAEIEQDLADPAFAPELLARRVGALDGIIYVAARITRGSSVDAEARRNLRVVSEAPVRLLEAWNREHGPTPFVYCSSIKVYGPPDRPAIDPIASTRTPDPWSYGSAKALAERLLQIGAERLGVSCAVVRPSYIYGPGQHVKNAIPIFLNACWRGEPPKIFGEGSEIRDDVLVSDVAYCLAEALLRNAHGPFNACGERARSLLEVAELCCRAVEELGGPSGLSPVTVSERAPKWWLDQRFDIERTRRELSYGPASMLDGLKREALWLRAGGASADSVRYSLDALETLGP